MLLLFGMASPVAAAKPVRGPVPLSPFTIPAEPAGCGSFDVLVEPLTNKEQEIDFFDQAGNPLFSIISGGLKVRLTNLDTGFSVDLNISGPTQIIYNADGTISVLTGGPALWWFSDGPEVAPGQPLLGLYHGRTESVFNATGFHFLSATGTVQDLCALLAGA
jgi:hypothetical protein